MAKLHQDTGVRMDFFDAVGGRIQADPELKALWRSVATVNEHLEDFLPVYTKAWMGEALEEFITGALGLHEDEEVPAAA